MLDLRHDVHDGIAFNWNGQLIRFDDWDDEAYGQFDYQTRDGSYLFSLDLQPVSGSDEVRIYILEQPGYEGRDIDGHSTHRLLEHDTGRLYVCVDDKDPPTNVPDALSWLVYWAEKTGEYITTGRKFS
jgi:hypothetical protein